MYYRQRYGICVDIYIEIDQNTFEPMYNDAEIMI